MKALKFIKGKLGYGVGAIGLDLSYGMFYSFLAKYLTDVLGLKSSFLIVLTALARIWDGINDPMMGTIVEIPPVDPDRCISERLCFDLPVQQSVPSERCRYHDLCCRNLCSLGYDEHPCGYSVLVDGSVVYERPGGKKYSCNRCQNVLRSRSGNRNDRCSASDDRRQSENGYRRGYGRSHQGS